MIARTFSFLFLFITSICWTQEVDFKKIDVTVGFYHDISSIDELVNKIDYDFKTDIEKARAAFSWIATNIEYINRNPFQTGNTKFYIVTDQNDYKRRLKREDQKTLEEAFSKRKTLCKGYALLFQRICDLLKIENQIIFGYIKNSSNEIGFTPTQKNHAWNAFKVDNEWVFLDITMGSGYSYRGVWQSKFNDAFFDIQKETIKNTHYAQKSVWREYIGQSSLEEFSALPFYSKAYFKDNFEILNHQEGEIKTRKRKSIFLQIKGIDFDTKVYYKYGDFGELKSAKTEFDGTFTSINIKSPKDDTTLKFFFDGKEAITYKVTIVK